MYYKNLFLPLEFNKDPEIGHAFNMYRNQGDPGHRALNHENEVFLTSFRRYLATYDVTNDRRILVQKKNGTDHLGHCYEGVAARARACRFPGTDLST